MTTYGVREFKTRVSDILRNLDDGEEVIITRRGKPCAKLTPIPQSGFGEASRQTLKGAMENLPVATYEDFLEAKKVWGRFPPESQQTVNEHAK